MFTITYTHVISLLFVPFGEEFGLSLNKLLCVWMMWMVDEVNQHFNKIIS